MIVAGSPTSAGVMVCNCQACWVLLEVPQAGLSMPVMPLMAADSTVPFDCGAEAGTMNDASEPDHTSVFA